LKRVSVSTSLTPRPPVAKSGMSPSPPRVKEKPPVVELDECISIETPYLTARDGEEVVDEDPRQGCHILTLDEVEVTSSPPPPSARPASQPTQLSGQPQLLAPQTVFTPTKIERKLVEICRAQRPSLKPSNSRSRPFSTFSAVAAERKADLPKYSVQSQGDYISKHNEYMANLTRQEQRRRFFTQRGASSPVSVMMTDAGSPPTVVKLPYGASHIGYTDLSSTEPSPGPDQMASPTPSEAAGMGTAIAAFLGLNNSTGSWLEYVPPKLPEFAEQLPHIQKQTLTLQLLTYLSGNYPACHRTYVKGTPPPSQYPGHLSAESAEAATTPEVPKQPNLVTLDSEELIVSPAQQQQEKEKAKRAVATEAKLGSDFAKGQQPTALATSAVPLPPTKPRRRRLVTSTSIEKLLKPASALPCSASLSDVKSIPTPTLTLTPIGGWDNLTPATASMASQVK
jgi:hypothetical protein